MNTKEFKNIMSELNVAYGDKRFPLTSNVYQVWFKYLKDCDADKVGVAIEDCVKSNPYPPSIADILDSYREQCIAEGAELKQAKSIYDFMVGFYPGGKRTEESERLFGEITGWNTSACYKVFDYIKDYVEQSERSGKTDIVSLEECLRRMPK